MDDLPSACIPTSEVADKVAAELAKVRKVRCNCGGFLHHLPCSLHIQATGIADLRACPFLPMSHFLPGWAQVVVSRSAQCVHICVQFACHQVDAESSVGTKRFMDMVSFLAAFDGFALAYSAADVLSYTSALAHKR